MSDRLKIIRDIVRKESLRIMKESQASFLAESSPVKDSDTKQSMKRINDYIDLLEKNIEKLNNEEKSAMNKEDYLSLKDIKNSQLSELTAMIKSYDKKMELLNKQKEELEAELGDVVDKGASIFKNQEMNEFNSDDFEKGWGLRIETDNHYVDLVKIMEDTNNFKLINTNIPGLHAGYVMSIPTLKIGGEGTIKVYRNTDGNRFEELEKPLIVKNIRKMFKNPQ